LEYLSSIRLGLLEELSRQINAEVVAAASRAGVAENDKRRAVYKLVRDRDRDVAAAFDDWRRSQMFFIAMEWRRLGLLTDEHLGHLSPEAAEALREFPFRKNS
jgi:hypothetical protein